MSNLLLRNGLRVYVLISAGAHVRGLCRSFGIPCLILLNAIMSLLRKFSQLFGSRIKQKISQSKKKNINI